MLLLVVACLAWIPAGYTLGRARMVSYHLERANRDLTLGLSQQAETEMIAVAKADPTNQKAYEWLGNHFLHTGDYASAWSAFGRLKRLNPRVPHLDCRLATCYLRLGDESDAYQLADNELKRDPNCYAALGICSTLLSQIGEQKKRLTYLQRMADQTPDDADVLRLLSETLIDGYQYDRALRIARHMVEIAPRDAEAYNLIGLSELGLAHDPSALQRAADAFNRSLSLNPINGGARLGLGRTFLALGRARDAAFQLQEAVRLLPNNARIDFELAKAYRLSGDLRKADQAQIRFQALQQMAEQESALRTRVVAYPKNPDYPKQLGLLLARVDEQAQGLIFLRKALAMRPGDREVKLAIEQIQSGKPVTVAPGNIPPAPATTAVFNSHPRGG